MMRSLVPKLRFGEFSGEWEEKTIESLYKFFPTKSFPRDKLNYKNGVVKNIHYGDIHTKFSTHFYITNEMVPYINESINLSKIKKESYCIEGDIIFADASEDLDDIGKSIEIVNLNNEKLLSGLHTLHARQKEKRLIIGFAGHLFKSNNFRNQIKKEAQGAKVLGISVRRLENITVYFPEHEIEQQKIANTLSSLDNLIEAQKKKVEALKKHKKGLMQQLFPREGEKEPTLRFEGFYGEWIEEQLINISPAIFDGTHQTPKYTEKGIPFFSVENIISGNKNKFISIKDYIEATKKNKPEKGDILITRIGNIGFSTIVTWDYDFSIYVTLAVIKQSKKFNSNYLHYYFQSPRYQSEILSKSLLNAVPCKINMDELRKTKVLLPKAHEQQKIANTLSSLDNLIEAQNKKIEALNKHKKGLMQQMFVSSEELA